MSVAFYLPGGVPIYAFSIVLGVGASLGLLIIGLQVEEGPKKTSMRAGIGLILGGIIGGHLGYLIVNWAYYQNNPEKLIQIPLGGFTWTGVVLGMVISILIIALIWHRPLPVLIDTQFPLIAVVTIASWLGCWMDGCAYGAQTDAWYAVMVKDEWGNLTERWPLQIVGVLVSLALLVVIGFFIKEKWFIAPGVKGGIGILGLSIEWWVLSTLRFDPVPQWLGQRLETWFAMGFTVLSTISIVIFYKRHRDFQKN